MKTLIPGVILFFVISGCSKSDQACQDYDRVKPTIKVFYPGAGEVYLPGQQLCFKAQLEDNDNLNRVVASINDKTKKAVKQYEFFPGSKIFVVDQKYIIPEGITQSFTLEFEGYDNNGNSVKVIIPLAGF